MHKEWGGFYIICFVKQMLSFEEQKKSIDYAVLYSQLKRKIFIKKNWSLSWSSGKGWGGIPFVCLFFGHIASQLFNKIYHFYIICFVKQMLSFEEQKKSIDYAVLYSQLKRKIFIKKNWSLSWSSGKGWGGIPFVCLFFGHIASQLFNKIYHFSYYI